MTKMNAKQRRELQEQERKKKIEAILASKAKPDPEPEIVKEEPIAANSKISVPSKSLPKAAGLKSTFTLAPGELLMTSFGRGAEALFQKKIHETSVSNIQDGSPAFDVEPKSKKFGITSQARIQENREIISDDPRSSKRTAGDDLIGARAALEKRYFGKEFQDNIHIQLIYRILDLKKILTIHANNIIYTLDNLDRKDEHEDSDFVGCGSLSLRNSYEVYCNPENAPNLDDETKKNLKKSYEEFQNYLKNPRLAYYGDAFFGEKKNKKKGNESEESNGRKDAREIYYILAMLSELRQYALHDSNSMRAWIFNLEKSLPQDAKNVLDGIYSKKIASLNDFVKLESKANFRLLFELLNADTDKKKAAIAVDFYKFTMLKSYKNCGFSIKLLRESILDKFYTEIKTDKKYDSLRCKLYQLLDFLIWNYYNKTGSGDELVGKLRAEIKRDKDEKSPIYDTEADVVWNSLQGQIKELADKLNRIYHAKSAKNPIDIKSMPLSQEEADILRAAINSAVDENGKKIAISEDVSYFSKFIYLLTLFLDGKEINDLLTTLINCFDEIEGFRQVLIKSNLEYNFAEEYTFFNGSNTISQELRTINSFARMSKDSLSGKYCMYEDAVDILGINLPADKAIKDYLDENLLNKEKLPKSYRNKPDTGFRNFICSNVLNSSRFRYIIRYGNPKKLKAVMKNENVVKFVLNDMPDTIIDRYALTICRKDTGSKGEKIKDLAKELTAVRFDHFKDIRQSENAEQNEEKAKAQGVISLYLNVLYQLIKNMVYVNSRYALAFAKLEHDAQLLGNKAGYEPKNTKKRYPYSLLTESFLNPEKDTDKHRLNKHASEYLSVNLKKSDDSAIRTYRNKIDHLNAVRNMDSYIGDLRELKSYFGIYHYIVQRSIKDAVKGSNINDATRDYLEMVDKYKTYCKDFVKALNVPFGYNLPRYKNLSIEGLFDKNRPGTKEEWLENPEIS